MDKCDRLKIFMALERDPEKKLKILKDALVKMEHIFDNPWRADIQEWDALRMKIEDEIKTLEVICSDQS